MAMKSTKTLAERYWPKVEKAGPDECWLWTASKDGHGYGQLRCDGKNRIATHIALELDGRPRPGNSFCALHKCDNPPCVNPNHLWWGTRKDNQQDALRKGRMDVSGLKFGHEISAAQGRRWIAVCCECGAEFKSTPLRLRVNHRNFCSRGCSGAWQSREFTGTPRAEFSQ